VGKIVFELKKVQVFNLDHVKQTLDAKNARESDYGILVTNAKKKKEIMGFGQEKGVIIIHPAGVFVLTDILRNNLIEIAKLNLNTEQRNQAIASIIKFTQSPAFKNSINTIIQDTIDLYDSMKKEVKSHITEWTYRIEKYRQINVNAGNIGNKILSALETQESTKKLQESNAIAPIEINEKID